MEGTYAAIFTIDVSDTETYGYQQLIKALIGAGWEYHPTSSAVYEGDLLGFRAGLEVLARGLPSVGNPTSVTVQAKWIGGEQIPGWGAAPATALANVTQMPLPSDGG